MLVCPSLGASDYSKVGECNGPTLLAALWVLWGGVAMSSAAEEQGPRGKPQPEPPGGVGTIERSDSPIEQAPARVASGADYRLRVLEPALALLLGATLLLICFKVLAPFVGALLWATVLTVTAWPHALRLTLYLGGRRRLAALLIAAAYVILLTLPLLYLSTALSALIGDGWRLMLEISVHGLPEPPRFLADIPIIGRWLVRAWQEDARNLPQLLTETGPVLIDVGRLLFRQLTDLVTALGEIIFGIFLATQMLSIGLPASHTLMQLATSIGGAAGVHALESMRRAIVSVGLWLIGSALVEAVLSGIGFWLADIPGAPVVAFVCFVCRVLQIKPWPIWIGVLAWLWWGKGDHTSAALLAIWLIVLVGGTGRMLRPILERSRPEVPSPVLFLAVLGGLLSWGFSGMFLGAAAIAVVWTLAGDYLRARRSARG